jgi:uncharacterized protein YqjF (DUF2071 family)
MGVLTIGVSTSVPARGRPPRPGRYYGYVTFPDNAARFKTLRMNVGRSRRLLRSFTATRVRVNCATTAMKARFRFANVTIRRDGRFAASHSTRRGREELTGNVTDGDASGTLKFKAPNCFSAYLWYAHRAGNNARR